MKKCEICGRLYDDSYDKCPHWHPFGNIKIDQNAEPPSNEEVKKGALSCLGCGGIIFLIIILIIIFDKPIPPKYTSEVKPAITKLDFGYITFDESDLPFLNRFTDHYFPEISLKDYEYSCFIDPEVWLYNPYSGKETLFIRCAAYGAVKTHHIYQGAERALIKTKIRNHYNGEVLGEYGFTGYKFK